MSFGYKDVFHHPIVAIKQYDSHYFVAIGREVRKLKIFPHLRSETQNIDSEKSHNGTNEYDDVAISKTKSCFSILQFSMVMVRLFQP